MSWPGLFLSLLAVLLTGVAFLVLPGYSQPPVTLTFLVAAPEVPTWKPLLQEFEGENPDIHIEVVEGPNATNLVEDLYTSAFLLGNSPYDLVYLDIVWVPKFAAAGWLMDLSNGFSAAELADFLPGDLAGGRYRGKLYRIPVRSDAGMLYYREDLLEKAGYRPPETFAELKEAAQALQAGGEVPWGYVWQGRQYEGLSAMFVEVLAGYGGFWIDPGTGEVGLDRPAAIEAATFLRETVEQGIAPPGVTTYQEEETRRLFQSGGAAFLRNWPYVWPLANGVDSPIRGKIGLKPMVRAPGGRSAACQGGWGWGIAKTTPHPEEAWRAVRFLSSARAQRQSALLGGFLPSRRSLYSDPELVQRYPHLPALLEVLQRSVLRPPIPQYAQASDILQRYLSAALTGRLSPERAMEAAAGETRRLLGTA